MTALTYFRHCSTCKTPIAYGARYYQCSVSTCNKKATALYFCSVPCWDAHVPDARHRDAWAEVETAPNGPTEDSDGETRSMENKPLRRKVASPMSDAGSSPEAPRRSDLPEDVLIVMSKLKGYIKASSDLRTSEGVSDPLSDHVRDVCDRAIKSARANERTTVLARDIEAALRGSVASD